MPKYILTKDCEWAYLYERVWSVCPMCNNEKATGIMLKSKDNKWRYNCEYGCSKNPMDGIDYHDFVSQLPNDHGKSSECADCLNFNL